MQTLNTTARRALLRMYRAYRAPVETRFGGVPRTLPGMAPAAAYRAARSHVGIFVDARARVAQNAYIRMADPGWRSCNTDQYCNTPRQLWAQAYQDARHWAHQAAAQQG